MSSSPSAHTATLECHPESRSEAVHNITVRVFRDPDGRLVIAYAIEGDLARVRMPPMRPPRIVQGLWQHTCCECFVALAGGPGYHEFNFAPSSEWAAYAFAGYRDGVPLADEALHPRITVRRAPGCLRLDASIPLGRLSAMHARAKLVLALSAVIEEEGGVFSYWALRHPAGKPDFHHRDSFVLETENVE